VEKLLRNWRSIRVVLLGGMILAGALLIGTELNAQVIACNASKECDVRITDGKAGDKVRILNNKGNPIADGKIRVRSGNRARIQLTSVSERISYGQPVLVSVENPTSAAQWAASASAGRKDD